MLINYLKTTFRSLKRHKLFSIINILGLAVGLTAAIFIFQYTGFQKSFDRHFEDHERIYRVMNERFEGDKMIQRGQITYSAVGPQLKEDYPEVEESTTLNFFQNVYFSFNEDIFIEDRVPFAENTYLELFDLNILAGVKSEMLDEPYEAIITRSLAEKVIGVRNSLNDYLGETISVRDDGFKIVGVVEGVPVNSSLNFNVLLSRSTLFNWWGDQARFSWNGSDYFHYVKLSEGVSKKDFESKLTAFSTKYFRGNEVTGTYEKFHLQSIADVHLDQSYEYENHDTADGSMVDILTIIAFFILIMAWVNYINLTTSKAMQRAKEVGMRKVVGASLTQLRIQFLLEALVVNLFSLVFALTTVQLLQKTYNQFAETEFSFINTLKIDFQGIPLVYWLLTIFLLGTLLSAVYPAFIMSKFSPSQTLKGNYAHSASGNALRKVLVVFQFILSTALIAFTAIISSQTSFMRNYDLGYNTDQVMTVGGPVNFEFDTTFVTRIHSFINALEANPSIEKVGVSTATFGQRLPRTFNVKRSGAENGVMLNRLGANYNFFNTYGIDLVAGRSFQSTDHSADDSKVNKAMLNAKAAHLLGFENPQDAISQRINFFGKDWVVIGVTEDFHFRSVKQSIEPLLFVPFYWISEDTYHIKYNVQNTQEVVEYASDTFNEFFPGNIVNYGFMDDRIQSQYKQDIQFGKVFNAFTLVGVLIACLGLVGLVGFSASRRTKEFGIRKVLGANIMDILKVISFEFIALIIVASLLAFPLIYLGANNWLGSFEYRIDLSFSFFFLPLLGVVVMALTIIVSQSLKTAQSNPIKSLREE